MKTQLPGCPLRGRTLGSRSMHALSRRDFVAAAGVLSGSVRAMASPAPEQARSRKLLAGAWTAEQLSRVLIPAPDWKPFPPSADRAAWEGLSRATREPLLTAGEQYSGARWEPVPATLFLEFVRTGNRSHFEHVQFGRRDQLRELVVAECVEGKGRFLGDIANGIWATCEETFWGVPAHLGLQKRGKGLPDVSEPVIDLFAAETASLLAWTTYLLGAQLDTVHPLVRERAVLEIERRILAPFREREDFWWMGLGAEKHPLNNWNPWINSNCLTCTLLIDSNGGRRAQTVHKAMRSLDCFLDSYSSDGGCDEGPSYWGRAGASLFDCLELLYSATGGRVNFYAEPLVGEMGRYIYRAHICDDWFQNIGDGPARMKPDGRLVFRWGRRIGDPDLQHLGAYFGQRQTGDPEHEKSIGRQLAALFDSAGLAAAGGTPPLVRDVWLKDLQVMAARRSGGSPEGLYLAAQGGHNGKSHSHNDVGNFVVYADGRPALIDVGVETYTSKTFSADRYKIWTMQSAYHNLPTVNGVMQAPGRKYAARDVTYTADNGKATFRLDIAAAYPAEAGLTGWIRTLRFDRTRNEIELHDAWELGKPGGQIALSFMTASKVTQTNRGELLLEGGPLSPAAVRLSFDAGLVVAIEEITADDPQLRSVWRGPLRRILLNAENVSARGEQVIRIHQIRR